MIPKGVSIAQHGLIANISKYLKYYGRNEEIIEKMSEGYCFGISILWLYARWLQAQPFPFEIDDPNIRRDDCYWFYETLVDLSKWREPEEKIAKLHNEIEEEISQLPPNQETTPNEPPPKTRKTITEQKLLNIKKTDSGLEYKLGRHLRITRNIERFISLIFNLHQDPFQEEIPQIIIEDRLEDTRSRKPHKEYFITATVNLEKLKILLATNNLIQMHKMLLIDSERHATGLFKDIHAETNTECYRYFDPNFSAGEQRLLTTDAIAETIFKTRNFAPDTEHSIYIYVFSFVPEHQPYPKSEEFPNKITDIMVSENINAYFLERYIIENNTAAAGRLIEIGTELTDKHPPALLLATQYNRVELVKQMLEIGSINPNVTDNKGRTALMLAIKNWIFDIADLLINHRGINLDAMDNKGYFPLSYAVKAHHQEENPSEKNRALGIIKLLIAKGAKIDKTNNDGWSSLMQAAYLNDEEGAQILIDAGADLIMGDRTNGNTALMLASHQGNLWIVKILTTEELLTNSRIDLDQKNNDGRTAIELAILEDHDETFKYLLLKGAKIERTFINEYVTDENRKKYMLQLLEKPRASLMKPLRDKREKTKSVPFGIETSPFSKRKP